MSGTSDTHVTPSVSDQTKNKKNSPTPVPVLNASRERATNPDPSRRTTIPPSNVGDPDDGDDEAYAAARATLARLGIAGLELITRATEADPAASTRDLTIAAAALAAARIPRNAA